MDGCRQGSRQGIICASPTIDLRAPRSVNIHTILENPDPPRGADSNVAMNILHEIYMGEPVQSAPTQRTAFHFFLILHFREKRIMIISWAAAGFFFSLRTPFDHVHYPSPQHWRIVYN